LSKFSLLEMKLSITSPPDFSSLFILELYVDSLSSSSLNPPKSSSSVNLISSFWNLRGTSPVEPFLCFAIIISAILISELPSPSSVIP